jgi:hypothetical protein
MLQAVGEASPQHFHLRFRQTPHMELPQPQLALDPRVQNSTILPRRRYGSWTSSLAIFVGNAITTGLSSSCATERPRFLQSRRHSGLRGQI